MKRSTRNKFLLTFLIGFTLVGVGVLARKKVYHQDSAIPSLGGLGKGRFHFPVSPIFLQTDERWSNDKIGGSGQSLGAVGCTISSVSMALANYGIEMTPRELNEQLKAIQGFTPQGLLIWSKIAEVTGQKVHIEIPEKVTYEAIDTALSKSRPVVAKILINQRVAHWVLIVGKEDQEYLIKDPMGKGKSLEFLSKYGSDIHAIRIVVGQPTLGPGM